MTMIPLEERTRARRLSPQSLSRPGALLQRLSASAGHFLHAARLSCGHAFLPRTHPSTTAPPAGKPARRAGPPLLQNRPADPRRGAVDLRAAGVGAAAGAAAVAGEIGKASGRERVCQ